LTTEESVSWEFAPTFDASERAALDNGKPCIYVCPPAAWALAPLVDRVPVPERPAALLVVVPEHDDAVEIAGSIGWIPSVSPVFAATGLTRTERVLRTGTPRTLVGTPATLLELVRRAALKLADVAVVAVAWPETFSADAREALETLLGESRQAQHLLATTDDATLGDLASRYAHRAPVAVCGRPPALPELSVRVVTVDDQRRPWAVREALDVLAPASAVVWEPLPARLDRWREFARDPQVRVVSDPGEDRVALAIATDLPSTEALQALGAGADEVVVLIRPAQLGYLQRIVRNTRPLHLRSESDRARDRAARLRQRVRERLDTGGLDAELLALGPLFDEWDPAAVAAAAAALAAEPPAPPATSLPAWVKVRLDVGNRDRLRPADVVGAILNSVGLPKDAVGRVDIRDGYTIVEIRAEHAEAAARGLGGITLRGRKVAARIDRR